MLPLLQFESHTENIFQLCLLVTFCDNVGLVVSVSYPSGHVVCRENHHLQRDVLFRNGYPEDPF
jgi:hypothetical protein